MNRHDRSTSNTPETSNTKPKLAALHDSLQTLRDELRLRLHLAGMEVKQEWAKLEPEVERLEHTAVEATLDAVRKLEKLMAKTEGGARPPR